MNMPDLSQVNIDTNETVTYPKPTDNVHVKLTMLIGAINVVRLATTDKELRAVMTNVLRAGGVLTDDGFKDTGEKAPF